MYGYRIGDKLYLSQQRVTDWLINEWLKCAGMSEWVSESVSQWVSEYKTILWILSDLYYTLVWNLHIVKFWNDELQHVMSSRISIILFGYPVY